MEKWLVVAGIWTMCAMCAVLFIRGATCSVSKWKRRTSRALAATSARGRRPGLSTRRTSEEPGWSGARRELAAGVVRRNELVVQSA